MVADRRALLVLTLLAACGQRDEHKPTPATPAPAPPPAVATAGSAAACEQLPFASTTTVPEASGAAWLDIDGKLSLIVIADSGHDGGFGIVDPEDGTTRMTGKLPLGTGAGDDLEGAAARGNRLVAITSSGYMREWEWQAGAFALVAGPYPIGAPPLTCPRATSSNCGNNYEGLAIAAAPIGGCAGYACSKETGSLYCLADQNGQLVATGAPPIKIVDRKDILADCSFDDRGALYAGNNLFGLSRTLRIGNLAQPDQLEITDLGPLGTGFPEVVAARGDIVYRMSDLGGNSPSLMFKFRCPSAGR